MKNEYIINNNTLALVPIDKTKTLVYEKKQTIIVNSKPNKILNINCQKYGSSLQGRLDNTEYLTGFTYKAPIVVIENSNFIFFPTSSPRLKDCSWINLNNVKDYYYDFDEKVTIIRFTNNQIIKFNISLNIINNQIFKASRLESIFRKNKLVKD